MPQDLWYLLFPDSSEGQMVTALPGTSTTACDTIRTARFLFHRVACCRHCSAVLVGQLTKREKRAFQLSYRDELHMLHLFLNFVQR
jgi:hypothetical protein